MTATTERMVAMIVAETNVDQVAKTNLIAGSAYAWNRALARFGYTTDSPEASPVIDDVIRILCAARDVEITR